MISTLYIKEALEQGDYTTNILLEKKTSGIQLADLEIEKGGKSETFRVFKSPHIHHRIYIETKDKKKKTPFNRKEKFEIEKTIMKGILKTPTNVFPNLINPINFESKNFMTLNHSTANEEDIKSAFESEFCRRLKPNQCRDAFSGKEDSMFSFVYPRCDVETLMNNLFNSSSLVKEVEQHEDKNVVVFYSFKEKWADEQASLKEIEKSLNEAGIPGEVRFSVAV